MMKVKETEAYIVQIVKQKEKLRAEDGDITLYEALTSANDVLGATDPDTLPDEAYAAAAKFVRADMNKMAKQAVEFVVELFELLDALPDKPTKEQITKVKESLNAARLPYTFTANLSRVALADVDYDYITEMAVEAGKEELAKSES